MVDDPGQRDDPGAHDDEGPPRGPLVVLVILVVLVVGTVFIMYRINEASTLQDCVASGRSNCAPIAAPQR